MGGFGLTEIIILFLIILVLFGAKRIPELFRAVGSSIILWHHPAAILSRVLKRVLKRVNPIRLKINPEKDFRYETPYLSRVPEYSNQQVQRNQPGMTRIKKDKRIQDHRRRPATAGKRSLPAGC